MYTTIVRRHALLIFSGIFFAVFGYVQIIHADTNPRGSIIEEVRNKNSNETIGTTDKGGRVQIINHNRDTHGKKVLDAETKKIAAKEEDLKQAQLKQERLGYQVDDVCATQGQQNECAQMKSQYNSNKEKLKKKEDEVKKEKKELKKKKETKGKVYIGGVYICTKKAGDNPPKGEVDCDKKKSGQARLLRGGGDSRGLSYGNKNITQKQIPSDLKEDSGLQKRLDAVAKKKASELEGLKSQLKEVKGDTYAVRIYKKNVLEKKIASLQSEVKSINALSAFVKKNQYDPERVRRVMNILSRDSTKDDRVRASVLNRVLKENYDSNRNIIRRQNELISRRSGLPSGSLINPRTGQDGIMESIRSDIKSQQNAIDQLSGNKPLSGQIKQDLEVAQGRGSLASRAWTSVVSGWKKANAVMNQSNPTGTGPTLSGTVGSSILENAGYAAGVKTEVRAAEDIGASKGTLQVRRAVSVVETGLVTPYRSASRLFRGGVRSGADTLSGISRAVRSEGALGGSSAARTYGGRIGGASPAASKVGGAIQRSGSPIASGSRVAERANPSIGKASSRASSYAARPLSSGTSYGSKVSSSGTRSVSHSDAYRRAAATPVRAVERQVYAPVRQPSVASAVERFASGGAVSRASAVRPVAYAAPSPRYASGYSPATQIAPTRYGNGLGRASSGYSASSAAPIGGAGRSFAPVPANSIARASSRAPASRAAAVAVLPSGAIVTQPDAVEARTELYNTGKEYRDAQRALQLSGGVNAKLAERVERAGAAYARAGKRVADITEAIKQSGDGVGGSDSKSPFSQASSKRVSSSRDNSVMINNAKKFLTKYNTRQEPRLLEARTSALGRAQNTLDSKRADLAQRIVEVGERCQLINCTRKELRQALVDGGANKVLSEIRNAKEQVDLLKTGATRRI